MYGGTAVAYGSKGQQCISLSSTDAKIVAASHIAAEVICLRDLRREMEPEETSASPIYVDNSGAVVGLSKDRRSCQRSRHLDRQDRKVREYVAHGCLEVHKIDASENVVE
eukprot:4558788-Pleurochrysis_carterae.AAC.1